MREHWSTYLPFVFRIVNSAWHSAIRCAPIQALFGDFITINRGLITAWDIEKFPHATSITGSDYLDQLNGQLLAIASASAKSQDATLRKRLAPNSTLATPRSFEEGDYVLISWPAGKPHKMSPLYRGPMLVVGHPSINTYEVLDLLLDTVARYDVSRLFLWNDNSETPPASQSTARKAAAAMDDDFHVVDFITAHALIENPPTRSRSTHQHPRHAPTDYNFRVRWLGLDDSMATWEPFVNVSNATKLYEYISTTPALASDFRAWLQKWRRSL